jgi:hypothetical protein
MLPFSAKMCPAFVRLLSEKLTLPPDKRNFPVPELVRRPPAIDPPSPRLTVLVSSAVIRPDVVCVTAAEIFNVPPLLAPIVPEFVLA